MLLEALCGVDVYRDPRVLVGYENADDAGVYLLDDRIALVQTVDFFTPVVDDPFVFGQIAAANALSDIYAMGADPLFSLCILGFPKGRLETSVLREIMAGGASKMREAKVSILGGHSVQDQEMKFGYAVTGVSPSGRVYRNSDARPGDILLLTKPIGTGVVSTAIKRGIAPEETARAAMGWMLELNRAASQELREFEVHAVTDITGYGLLGHALEIARASRLTMQIEARAVPLIEGVLPLAEQGAFPGGQEANRRFIADGVAWNDTPGLLQKILLDPQTSGGLLITVPAAEADRLEARLAARTRTAARIGQVVEYSGVSLDVR